MAVRTKHRSHIFMFLEFPLSGNIFLEKIGKFCATLPLRPTFLPSLIASIWEVGDVSKPVSEYFSSKTHQSLRKKYWQDIKTWKMKSCFTVGIFGIPPIVAVTSPPQTSIRPCQICGKYSITSVAKTNPNGKSCSLCWADLFWGGGGGIPWENPRNPSR